MKKNVNVFIAVLLVAVLCGGVIWLQTADEEKLGWNIHDSYGDTPSYSGGAAYTNATFAGPSAAEGGVMPLSSSSALRARTSYSYAGAYAISYGVNSMPLTSNLSPLTYGGAGGGQGLYTTSSKTFNSYGGGNGGAAMGGAMSNGQSNWGASNPSLQGGAGVGSISPIAYSTARRSEMTAMGENLAIMAAENPVMAMTNAANAGTSNGFYGGYTAMDYSGSANYGQYTGMFGGGSRMGIRGRQNGADLTDSWFEWMLDWLMANNGPINDGSGWYFNDDYLDALYAAFLARWEAGGFVGVQPPTQADFEAWFLAGVGESGGKFSENNIYWAPVGDILPLLLIALLYILFVTIKSKSLKSLLKTERSE